MSKPKFCAEPSSVMEKGKRVFVSHCGRPATKEYNRYTHYQPQIRAEWYPVCNIHARVVAQHYRFTLREIKAPREP